MRQQLSSKYLRETDFSNCTYMQAYGLQQSITNAA